MIFSDFPDSTSFFLWPITFFGGQLRYFFCSKSDSALNFVQNTWIWKISNVNSNNCVTSLNIEMCFFSNNVCCFLYYILFIPNRDMLFFRACTNNTIIHYFHLFDKGKNIIYIHVPPILCWICLFIFASYCF